MRANVTPRTVQKSAKAIASVQHVCQLVEKQMTDQVHSGHHAPFGNNFCTILKVLV